MRIIAYDQIHIMADMSTDSRLLPEGTGNSTNREEVSLYKTATRMAMERFLTPEQRDIIEMHYLKGMSKTEIGARLGITPSCVCKKLKTARGVLKRQVEYFMAVRRALTQKAF